MQIGEQSRGGNRRWCGQIEKWKRRGKRGSIEARSLLAAIIACVTARIGESDKAIKRGGRGASTYRGIRFYLGALVTVHVNDAR